MTRNHWMTLAAALSVAALGGCAKGEQAGQPADSTARNLTLAPAESTAAMKETAQPVPAPKPTPKPKPAAPTTWSLAAGTSVSLSVTDTVTSRTAKAGDTFTAAVGNAVKDAAGHVVIPEGSTATGSIVEVAPAPNPRSSGTMRLAVTSVTVRGTTYPIEAAIDSVETVMQGRGVTGADVAKVGAGTAAGAIAGRIIGKNKKGTVIGGLIGAAVGAGAARASRDIDIVLPAGGHLVITLTKPFSVKAS